MRDPDGRVSSIMLRQVVSRFDISVPRVSKPIVGSEKSGGDLSRKVVKMQEKQKTKITKSTTSGRETSNLE